MDKIIIVTGGSRGIGKAIIEAYQSEGYHVFSIARSRGEFANEDRVIQFLCDLSKEVDIQDVLPQIFKRLDSNQVKRIVLVNNAGTLGEIGRIENLNSEKITWAIQLNTLAPLLLSSEFIRLTKHWSCEKKIINISSGAAQNPYYGWAVYCSTKAALDMMTKVIALEQNEVKNGVSILSVSPGVVDTDMQAEIRKHKKEDFITIDRFLELKSSGSLLDPKIVGDKIFNIDQQQLPNGSILRVE